MLGNRSQMRIPDSIKNRGMGIRRRHGSLSSLPSSSISGRPIRDRRRNDDRRKVKDVKVCIHYTYMKKKKMLRLLTGLFHYGGAAHSHNSK